MPEITEKDIYKLIYNLVNFPFSQICIHNQALNLLSLLEEKGFTISKDLVKSISDASGGDEESSRILGEILNKQ